MEFVMAEMLLQEISAIIKKYALIGQKTGAYFNVFDIANISSDEIAICRMIYELLNPNGSHHQGCAFLRLFVNNVLKLNFSERDFKTACVIREYPIRNMRRIDLFLETENYGIPIEVKIKADDREKQCFDYYQYAKNANVFYLTLDGGLPSEYSADGLTHETDDSGELVGYKEVTTLSFSIDIIRWLENCIAIPEIVRITPIREIILQFKDVLCRLTGRTEGEAKMDIKNAILKSTDTLKSALEIEKVLPEIKSAVMGNLLSELARLFEANNVSIYGNYDDPVSKYYTTNRQQIPSFSIEIFEFASDLTGVMFVEVYWQLYFGFAFAEWDDKNEYYNFLTNEEAKKRYPRKYSKFVDAVISAMGDGEKNDMLIFWDYLTDDNGQKYDFKHFSPACANLTENCEKQAQKMFELLCKHAEIVKQILAGQKGTDHPS